MRIGAWLGVVLALVVSAAASGPSAATDAPDARSSVDELIERFDPAPMSVPAGEVDLDAWIEEDGGRRAIVVAIEPKGQTRLIADPGITITPAARSSVEWLLPLPYRHVDPAREYFEPQATMRLPFAAKDERPIELNVEYAYCLIDYQCFFGGETITVVNRLE